MRRTGGWRCLWDRRFKIRAITDVGECDKHQSARRGGIGNAHRIKAHGKRATRALDHVHAAQTALRHDGLHEGIRSIRGAQEICQRRIKAKRLRLAICGGKTAVGLKERHGHGRFDKTLRQPACLAAGFIGSQHGDAQKHAAAIGHDLLNIGGTVARAVDGREMQRLAHHAIAAQPPGNLLHGKRQCIAA